MTTKRFHSRRTSRPNHFINYEDELRQIWLQNLDITQSGVLEYNVGIKSTQKAIANLRADFTNEINQLKRILLNGSFHELTISYVLQIQAQKCILRRIYLVINRNTDTDTNAAVILTRDVRGS
jgi:hypothetical protein